MMKRRNKGFTLVELIIAAAILAMVATPLLANFVSTAKMNEKSRKNLDAMNLAQDIMEGLSPFTADEVVKAFNSMSKDEIKAKFLPSSISDIASCSIVSANSTPLTKTYTMNMDGIMQGVTGKKRRYDVEIVLTPKLNNDSSNVPDENISYGKDVTFLAPTDPSFDVSYQLDDAGYASAMNAFDSTKDESFFTGKLVRETFLTLDSTPVYAADGITIESYNYTADLSAKYKVEAGAVADFPGMSEFVSQPPMNIFSNGVNTYPRNITLFYHATPRNSGSTINDKFIIENKTDKPVHISIIRVLDNDLTSIFHTDDATNMSYKAGLTVVDHVDDIASIKTTISTNMTLNLSESFKANVVPSRLSERQGRLEFYYLIQTPSAPSAVSVPTGTQWQYLTDGAAKTDKAMVYDATVTVHRYSAKGTVAEEVASFTGSLSN